MTLGKLLTSVSFAVTTCKMGVIYQPGLLYRVAMTLEGGKNCAELNCEVCHIWDDLYYFIEVHSELWQNIFFLLFFIYTVLLLRDIKRTVRSHHCGWHHQLDGHESEQTPGVGDGQGSLACCSPWGHKESDTTERLYWRSQALGVKWSRESNSECTAVVQGFKLFWKVNAQCFYIMF